ncbi:MAG: tyrosine-type recombinase/integrase [Chloroflexi bacterium]|nr:tyrosine-type recombinase/integrase [Chloroflexota bacterium]MBU1746199.1 tyrosine-type recombinase/integrase [Chloroflexota bacterium]
MWRALQVLPEGGHCLHPDDCAVPLTRAAQLFEERRSLHALWDFVRRFIEDHYPSRPVPPVYQALVASPPALTGVWPPCGPLFGWAVQTGQITTNPAAAVPRVRQARRTPQALSASEVYQLQRTAASQRQLAEAQAGPDHITAAVVKARRDEALLNLFLYTGLRVGEVAALKTTDVVLGERSGKVVVRSGRGRQYREVPLHQAARHALAAYLAVRPADRGDSLFQGRRGPLAARGIQMRLAALGKAAQVDVTPHVLRHTLATRLLREVEADLVAAVEGLE